MIRADDRLQRLLLAFPLMADEPNLTLDDIAQRIGTSTKVLARDFASLERYDVPAGWVDTVQVVIDDKGASMRSANFHRPQRLNRPEMLALELGLRMLQQELPVDEREAVAQVRTQLQAMSVRRVSSVTDQRAGGEPIVERREGATEVESAPEAQLASLATLHVALERREVVALDYRRPDEGQSSVRRVRPYALVRADAHVYMVAYCERADALRIFRLDRMVGVSLTGDGFDPPVAFSVQDVLQGGRVFRRDEPPGDTLVVRYSSRVSRWIAEREHRSLDEQGELVVEYPLADEAWAVRHVLQYGPDAVILQPVALRDRVAAVLDALLP